MIDFIPDIPTEEGVTTNAEIPKDLDIFYRVESQFLPPGKTFKNLTPEEQETVRNKYRFDPYKPGIYQTITGYDFMIN